jgi:hypothetical protein
MSNSLEKFLSKNQPKTNQNPKFSDSSPTASVFGRLGFDFVPSDPTILELSEGVKKHLQQTPKLIKDWQAEDLRNGTTNVRSYFKNPVFNISKSIQNNLQKIRNSVPTSIFVDTETNQQIVIPLGVLAGIYEQANVAIDQVQQYIAHTDRLSNVVDILPEVPDLPHYQQAMAVGRQLLYIVYQTDNVQNNTPILGTFTSIFVGPELVDLNDIIEPYSAEIANSIIIIEPPPGSEDGGATISSNLSPARIETITNEIKSIKTFVERRRKHDENFWTKAQMIVEEYQLLKSMNDGEVQQLLINDYVGTDELKDKLKTKEIPVEPSYNVSVAYDGTITYTPRKPTVNAITLPSFEDRSTPIEYIVDYVEDLPEPTSITGIVPTFSALPKVPEINDTYAVLDTNRTYRWSGLSWYQISGHLIGDSCYITTTGETYLWNGIKWTFDVAVTPTSPTIALDEYIQIYSSNTINISFDGYTFDLSVGAFSFNTVNGVWSANANVTILNTGTKDYTFTGVSVSNFLNSDIQYSMNVVGTNTIFYTGDPNIFGTVNTGNTMIFTVSARNLSEANTTDYGKITIVPGIEFPVKVVSNVSAQGILLPASVTQNVGSPTARLLINEVNGPYRLLATGSIDPDFYTWRNDSDSPVTISSITDITPAEYSSDMVIELYQATTPNTINVNDSVLWYANVTPSVEFPNSFVYLVETSDGQERILTIGIDRGNVDDNNLFNEIVNTNPDIVVTNSAFDIRVFGGKANTLVTLSGPNISTTKFLDANGFSLVANTTITSNGTYTYVLDFAGTGHRRTITKAIFS